MNKTEIHARLTVYRGLVDSYISKTQMLSDTALMMLERGDARRASYFYERVQTIHNLIDELQHKMIEMFVNDGNEWNPMREGTHMSWYHSPNEEFTMEEREDDEEDEEEQSC